MRSRRLQFKEKMRTGGNSAETVMSRGRAAVLLALGIALCGVSCMAGGCTRREQLVLETAEPAEGVTEGDPAGAQDTVQASEEDEAYRKDSGQQAAQSQSRTDAGSQAGQSQASAGGGRQDGTEQFVAAEDQSRTGDGGSRTAEQPAGTQQPGQSDSIWVHVCGAVNRAGVYELPAGSRVYEAVRAAGGFAENADESYVNQAQRLSDGAKLVIPTMLQVQEAAQGGNDGGFTEQIGLVEQTSPAAEGDGRGMSGGAEGSGDSAGQAASTADGRININTASEAQLCEIPGIGATRAAAIAAYRQEHGGFSSIEEIMNVNGIKEGTYAKMKDRIKIE